MAKTLKVNDNSNIIAHCEHLDERTADVTLNQDIMFQSMFISHRTLEGLTKTGFRKPSPIQLKAIPLGKCGFDMIVKSKSGTGKTLVFSVIALENINPDNPNLQVLILAPTREIAVQICDVIRNIGCDYEGLKVETFIGGLPEKDDIEKAKNCQIAIGAPGRVKSLIKQNILNMSHIKLWVLDEADKLIGKSFQTDVNEIYSYLPQKKQIIATSATFEDELHKYLSHYMLSPTYVTSENETPLLLGLKHFIREIKPSSNPVQDMNYKNEELTKLLTNVPFTQCLIYSNYQTRAENINLIIDRHGWKSSFISAGQPQKKRLTVMENFKNFQYRVLVSTDLTSRGIDASNVDLIINYDVPLDISTYLHRMGRAGRYGSKGTCITLISNKKDLTTIRRYLGKLGGTNLTISKIDSYGDLWNADPNQFEQISGIVDDEDTERTGILEEVMDLKSPTVKESLKRKKKEKTSDKDDTKSILESMMKGTLDLESVFSENVEESPLKRLNSLETIIQQSNDNEEIKVLKEDTESNSVLESLMKGDFQFQKPSTSDDVLAKNKALFDVAKILTNKIDSTNDETENLDSFLKIRKSETEVKSPEENLLKQKENLKNLFEHAYRFVLDGKTNWQQLIARSELKKALAEGKEPESEEVDYEEEIMEEEEEEEEEEDEEYTEEDFRNCPGIKFDENGKRIYEYEDIPNRMVWVPVETSVLDSIDQNAAVNLLEDDEMDLENGNVVENQEIAKYDARYSTEDTDLVHQNSEHFDQYFNECSRELWENGLSFNRVEDFDHWFMTWKQKVNNVTEYVRQNIYIREMSVFQNGKQ